MLNDLRIHWKLALLSATFLAPITMLTWLLVNQSYQDINFSLKEVEGNRYVSVLREAATQLALDQPGIAAQQLDTLAALQTQLGNEMKLGDDATTVTALIGQAANDTTVAPQAVTAIRELISKIGDGSNLILDPDLDSYYSMIMVVLKLPRAIDDTVGMTKAVQRLQTKSTLSTAEQVELQVRQAELKGVVASIESDLHSAYQGNPDGSLKAAFESPYLRYRELADVYFQRVSTAGHSSAELDTAHRQLINQTQVVWKIVSVELDRLLHTRIANFKHKLMMNLEVTAAVLVLAAFLSWLIGHSISRPVAGLVQQMSSIAAGDLSSIIVDKQRRDEIGLLTRTALDMRQKLHALTAKVRDTALDVDQGALAIVGAVEAQAATATEVTTTVVEITSTMEELSASSTHIAEHTQLVVDIAHQTWESSKEGSSAMQTVQAKIAEIRTENQASLQEIVALGSQSKEISKVMLLINAVADQTKLIAFNAALEASSAGDAGRRFSIVAAEIRRLADSVTQSTGAIEARINDIQSAINRLVITSERGAIGIADGMTASADTAKRLDQLVDAARQTSSAAEQISISAQQQKTASKQVLLALREIVDASAHSAQSMNNVTQISRDMTATSAALRDVVGQFKLDRE